MTAGGTKGQGQASRRNDKPRGNLDRLIQIERANGAGPCAPLHRSRPMA